MLSVRNGLLVIIMLISNHKSLAEQLVSCDVTAVLKKCLTLSRAETMLAIIALNHISMVHKLESKGTADGSERHVTASRDHNGAFVLLKTLKIMTH